MEWISVEDEWPEIGEAVLISYHPDNGMGPTIGCIEAPFDKRPTWYGKHLLRSFFTTMFVTHWMPLPDPPKEKGPFYTAYAGASILSVFHTEHGFICRERDEKHTHRVCNRLNKIWMEERSE